MELNDLLNETSPLKATYKTHEFNLNVFTEKLTPAYKARLIALTTINEEHEGEKDAPADVKDENAQLLSDLIESWDVVLNGAPYPPTYDNFLSISYPLMAALMKQITTHLGDIANPPKETASPNS